MCVVCVRGAHLNNNYYYYGKYDIIIKTWIQIIRIILELV